MAREANTTDFTVPVDGVGHFVFGQRKMGDHIKINVEYARMIEGVEPTPWLDMVATWMATLKVLTVRAPDGFVVDDLDPLDDETYGKLMKIHAALVAKEGSFRKGKTVSSEANGKAAGEVI